MNEIVRTPSIIASEIYSIKGQTRNVILLSSVEIGKRLVEAKEMLSHGEWGHWLQESVEYSQSTANNLMAIYREFGSDEGKIPMLGNISYTKAIALLGVPADEREDFVKENDVENMSARELQKVIKEKQKLEKEHEKLAKNIEKLQKQLEKANAEKVDPQEIEKLQGELSESKDKVKKLEKALKEKPLEAATVEVVPKEIEDELTNLRKQVSEQGSPESSIKFKLRFEALVAEFKNVLEALKDIADSEEKEKYKSAVSGLIGKMQERL